MNKVTSLLDGEASIPLYKNVGKKYGICGALLVQQLHFCLCTKGKDDGSGVRWVLMSYQEWAKEIELYGVSSIRTSLRVLEGDGVIKTRNFSNNGEDGRPKWYTLVQLRLQEVVSALRKGVKLKGKTLSKIDKEPCQNLTPPPCQNLTPPPCQNLTPLEGENLAPTLSKIDKEPCQNLSPTLSNFDTPLYKGDLEEKIKREKTGKIAGAIFNGLTKNGTSSQPGEDEITLNENPPMATQVTSSAAILQRLKESKTKTSAPAGNDGKSAQALWRLLVPKHHPSVGMIPEFTMAQKSQLAKIAKAIPGMSDSVLKVVLPEWIGFTNFVADQSGLKVTPSVPNIGFLLKHIGEATSYVHSQSQVSVPKKPKAKVVKELKVAEEVTTPKPVEDEEGDEIASAEFIKNWKPT